MDMKRVVLSGGPEYLPAAIRLHEVTDLKEEVKVQCGAGYEHFEPTDELRTIEGELLPVFAWCSQTRIAE
jgi:Family of unknown function (DUF5988)